MGNFPHWGDFNWSENIDASCIIFLKLVFVIKIWKLMMLEVQHLVKIYEHKIAWAILSNLDEPSLGEHWEKKLGFLEKFLTLFS